jgi:hypothetical protein
LLFLVLSAVWWNLWIVALLRMIYWDPVPPWERVPVSTSRVIRPCIPSFSSSPVPMLWLWFFPGVLPCSLCPVTASARFMGNCGIIVLNVSGGVFLFILHLTDVPEWFGVMWNTFYLVRTLFFVEVDRCALCSGLGCA